MNMMICNLRPYYAGNEMEEAKRAIDEMTKKSFQQSLSSEWKSFVPQDIEFYNVDYNWVWGKSQRARKVSFNSSTLSEAGSGIVCLRQGLRVRRNDNITFEELADIASDNGYCSFKYGTAPELFDALGLKRACHVKEVFDALLLNEKPIVTVLLSNGEDFHYVNLAGFAYPIKALVGDGPPNSFLVYDPERECSFAEPMENILSSIEVAWIW